MSVTKCLEFALLATAFLGNASGKIGKYSSGATELVFQGLKNASHGIKETSEWVEGFARGSKEFNENLEKGSQNLADNAEELAEEWVEYAKEKAEDLQDFLDEKIGEPTRYAYTTLKSNFLPTKVNSIVKLHLE